MSIKKLKLYIKIFFTFLKVSSFTFGGGYAMLPILQSEIVEKNKWMDHKELMDLYSMVQVVPGMIYVSTCSSIAYKVGGVVGAIIASIAVLIPSGASIMVLYLMFKNYYDNDIFKKIVIGIISGVAATTIAAAWTMAKTAVNNNKKIIIFFVSLVLLEVFYIKTIYVVCLGILIGIGYSFIMKKRVDKINA